MDIHGIKVNSATFGVGVVTEQTDSMVTIDFGGTVKKFLYPSCFADFLTAEDPATQQAIVSEIASIQAAEASRQRAERRREMIIVTQQKSASRKGGRRK